MNPQLIYFTDAPEVVDWVITTNAKREAIGASWLTFLEEVTAVYPLPVGLQRVLAIDGSGGLVMGIRLGLPEETLDGWQYNDVIHAWVPDTTTDTGRTWQRKLNDLPRNDIDPSTQVIGMPQFAHIHLPNGLTANFGPNIMKAVESDTVFALWDVREIRDGVNAALAELEKTTGFHWEEMPRSQWYARVERFEAQTAAADAAWEEAVKNVTTDTAEEPI